MSDKANSLPASFLSRMKEMLREEYEPFLKSYENPRTFGLRVNTSKISCEEFEKIAPFPIRPIPWTDNGYFYHEESRPARCPYYQAGLYYLQEPSAMTPASRLPVEPGDYVLDLCAAPGGKATALGSALNGQGLLVANDISTSRARALLRNLELFGITNSFVTNESPDKLVRSFPEFFHKIVLDAPCSGEGMFRKDDSLIKDWSPEKSHSLSQIQRQLILQAADMLRSGGMLLYSTCTFAPKEDEEIISYLLDVRSDMELVDIPWYEGFTPGFPSFGGGREEMKKCVRIFPHKMDGEGHFMALLKKSGQAWHTVQTPRLRPDKNSCKWIEAFFREIGLNSIGGAPFDWSRVEIRGDKVYYLPPASVGVKGITFLRNGLYLGDLKKNRFEPSQPFALALHKGDANATVDLPADDPRISAYLKGEPISICEGEARFPKGWQLLTINGYPLAFGKLVGQTLKNKYPSGWRL